MNDAERDELMKDYRRYRGKLDEEDTKEDLTESEEYDDGEEYDDEGEYDIGDDIEVRSGDRIAAPPYGVFWVVRTGVVGGLWTSQYKEDLKTGQGRGLRQGYVSHIQKEGKGKWYEVRWDHADDDVAQVTGISDREPEDVY